MRWRALLALCGLAAAAHPALAESRSVSYSTWIVGRDSVMLRFVMPAAAAQRLTGADIPVLTVSKLGDYVLRHTAVWASGRDCPASDQGYDLGKVDPIQVGPGLYGFEIVFRCAGPMSRLTLHNHALFARVPAHVDFARIEINGHSVGQLFTAGHERLEAPDTGAMPAAGIGWYVRLGLLHILRSPDRLCFLLAALLLVRRARDLGQVIAGLTGGYGLSLLVEAPGLIRPQVTLIDASVGFLVALLGTALAMLQLERRQRAAAAWPALLLLLAAAAALWHALHPALLLAGAALLSAGFLGMAAGPDPRRPAFWLVPAGILGFLDGFVMPSMLAPMRLSERAQAPMTIGYDLGALLVCAGLMGLAAGAFAILNGRRLAPSRAALNDIAAACLGGLGTFWLLSRLHS